jgi:hypothetical protein
VGYYVRYDVSLIGDSRISHNIDVLCESPEEKIACFYLGKTDDVGEEVPAGSKNRVLEEHQILMVIQTMAISFDIHARACILVRKGELRKVSLDLAHQNGITVLREE